jgi:hypothetical protein
MRERDENLPEISKSMIDVVYVQKQTRQWFNSAPISSLAIWWLVFSEVIVLYLLWNNWWVMWLNFTYRLAHLFSL